VAQSSSIGQTDTPGGVPWNSFDLGDAKMTTINSGAGATLNRVTGGRHRRNGRNATDRGYHINPQGVVIGSIGIVTTGWRLVASALDVIPAAFMRGDALLFAAGSNDRVVLLEKIGSSGGDVFLMRARRSQNEPDYRV
jgi:hypothetical protein